VAVNTVDKLQFLSFIYLGCVESPPTIVSTLHSVFNALVAAAAAEYADKRDVGWTNYMLAGGSGVTL